MYNDFPHPKLTPIRGRPTPHDIQRLRRELVANAMAIPSTHGGGQHGHLGLILSPDEYLAIAKTPFIAPLHPGEHPLYDADATDTQIYVTNATYQRNLDDFTVYSNTKNALREQILAAVSKVYIDYKLSDPMFGYAFVAPLDLVHHLTETYGEITDRDLLCNRDQLQEPWDPADDLATLWTRAKTCQDFARNSIDPISDNTLMYLLLLALAASGVMMPYIDEWKRRDDGDQTFHNFRVHFERANQVRLYQRAHS